MTHSDDATASDGKLSKKERIRDNQRRSRLRRQEYLSDLERRLADSHNICREAELQQDTLQELQAENNRLRELLTIAGVNNSFIDTYVHQRTDIQESTFRHLRPKLPLGNGHATPGSSDAGAATAFRHRFAHSEPGVLLAQSTSDMNFQCDGFNLLSNGSFREASDDAIPCAAAQELIDQYCLNSEEMELIKAHLDTSFSKPEMPNQGC